jgi:hypothetical protein
MTTHDARHRATFSLVAPANPTPGSLPEGHLERINVLQRAKGKNDLRETDLIARPIRLFGNQLTSYYTRVPDADLQTLAEQINTRGGALLSAHVTDATPIGTYYFAEVVQGEATNTPAPGEPMQPLFLDTWAYWLNDENGQQLSRQIDGGIINEASIGYWYDQVLCSITGASYYNSPYWAGRTYDIVDAETGETTTRLCFLWTTGNIDFAEGSLVYRGAYPGTRVGGTAPSGSVQLSANANAPAGPTPHTRFQLAASQDMTAAFQKAAVQPDAGKPDASPPAPAEFTPQEDTMARLTLKLLDGSAREVEPTEVQDLLTAQIQGAEERGVQRERERLAKTLGLEPKDAEGTATPLVTLAAEAADGRTYRNDLLEELQSLHVTLSGGGDKASPAAERARRAYSALTLTDIREEVERLRLQRDAAVPNTQLSDSAPETEANRQKPRDFDAV